ncbi:MAG: protein-L-isoaspartate(D-aspartate) O-methyltransferase [Candidatus Verstraetearchaeota archaeon]|jgi:protein-L-isoaspartate(D-aspartate) O-methyltransferase|nr:protein-L-isoaspartate O-methyltransferase [Candidatus Culexarchaeum yellowstonense]NHV11807.1 protein-L-isoaspartate(D-aspartate) O-methyltransferase [Candidatus Verstraetearchaeota archaeon]
MKKSFDEERRKLIEKLISEGVLKSQSVIRAMLTVPRELFVPPKYRELAYIDAPLPTLEGQTISAPHMVAIICELLMLDVGMKVLEVGGGSGYHAAVCAEIVAPKDAPREKWGHVYTIERIPALVEFAKANLKICGYDDRVDVILGDGTLGYKEAAPYDRIFVTAAAPNIPKPLINQLKDGGRIVIPIGGSFYQELVVGLKKGDELLTFSAGGCVFVPLIGKYGWKEY